jgi:hypothetical protein
MFTPGKLTVDQHRGSSGWIYICPGDSVLPFASTHGHFPETQEADARLIAASKDLYQAVLDLLPLAEHLYGVKSDKVAAIQAIIDQVRGTK